MERKLASIRQISSIVPIEGADCIEIAKVDGWQCVVKKNEFKEGDLAVYFEIDSWIPSTIAPFLTKPGHYAKTFMGVEGERLKTVRLRKELSQGLLLPLSSFNISNPVEGLDVTELLKINKYEVEIPAHLAGLVRGNWPTFIPKTDEERIQNLSRWFELYKDIYFEESIKLDGSSMTCYFNNDYVGVCSRNLDLKEDLNNSFWKMANFYNLQDRLKTYKKHIAIQGELIGEGIQDNRLKIKGQDFRVFNIWSIDEHRYYLPEERYEILNDLNRYPGPILRNVPVTRNNVLIFKNHDMSSLLEHANQISKEFGTLQEGFVYKSCSLINNNIISFKVISNNYLEKYKE